MDYPSSLLGIVRNAATKHKDDIDEAVACAERAWNDDPERAEWIDQMVRGELRSLIHSFRHQSNVEIRKAAGVYGQPAKVTLETGAVARVASNVLLEYTICGVVLGRITGKQLKVFAKTEQEKADGSAFNARLCNRLIEIVPEEKTVAECVTAKKAKSLIEEVAKSQKRRTRQKVA